MRQGHCITTERLQIRHWDKATDGDAFFRLNNDPKVMQFFPGRRTRAQSDALLDKIKQRIVDDGYGWSAISLKNSKKVIGFGGIAKVLADFPNGPSAEIGWRFVPETWGKGYATEMAKAIIHYGFEELDLPEILSFAVTNNEKSLAVMSRAGMQRHNVGDFDHPNVDATRYPNLVRHHCYRIDQEQWKNKMAAQ